MISRDKILAIKEIILTNQKQVAQLENGSHYNQWTISTQNEQIATNLNREPIYLVITNENDKHYSYHLSLSVAVYHY